MFFRDLCGVNKVIVLGHSLSEVDRPYLIKVKESINQNAAWCVTYLGNEEREKHRNSLHKIGVNDESIKLVEMNSLINAIAI
jgi:DNA-binding protein Fis